MTGTIATEENHSIFDFPYPFGDAEDVAEREGDRIQSPKKSRRNNGTISNGDGGRDKSPAHPYPSSISFSVSHESSPISDRNEVRSPNTSPAERGGRSRSRSKGRRGKNVKEVRQQISPFKGVVTDIDPSYKSHNRDDFSTQSTQYLNSHHQLGQLHFHRNHLSEAVDAYSRSIHSGLEELKHRKGMVGRISGTRHGRDGGDDLLVEMGEKVAFVHLDMALALEVAGKYSEAGDEIDNAIGLLQHTCHFDKRDSTLKRALKDRKRMERASSCDVERKKQSNSIDAALRRLESAKASKGSRGIEEMEDSRNAAAGCIKRLIVTERESLGEQSYAVAKLKLKLAKLKCEGGDISSGLNDAEAAVETLKHVLGPNHTLVGASCLFAATAYEKRVSMISSSPVTSVKPIELLTQECKTMLNRALELYADALQPMKFKHNSVEEGTEKITSPKKAKGLIQPDLGEVFHKIGRLYAKKGMHSPARNAYQDALESYGVSSAKNAKSAKGESRNFHPDAAAVWSDLAELFLESKDHHDSLFASDKSLELARGALATGISCSERIETLPMKVLQLKGCAYESLRRHEDATRSYKDALAELKKARTKTSKMPNPQKNSDNLGPATESQLLRKIGNSLLRDGITEEAKLYLIDALRMLRSDTEAASEDLPPLLAEIGMVHNRSGDYANAMKVLRPCLKLYADRGVPDYDPNVEKARQLFQEAQRGMAGGVDTPRVESISHRESHSDNRYGHHDGTPVTMPMTTPSTHLSTLPSNTQSYNITNASESNHSQLKTLVEELSEMDSKPRSMPSPPFSSSTPVSAQSTVNSRHQQQSLWNPSHEVQELNYELRAMKMEHKRLQELHERDMHQLKSQLETAENTAEQLQLRVKQVEEERDQEKKERVIAATAHRKEMETATKRIASSMKSEHDAEVESLRKEIRVSEDSYHKILKAVDEEKEHLKHVHESELKEVQNQLEKVRKELEVRIEDEAAKASHLKSMKSELDAENKRYKDEISRCEMENRRMSEILDQQKEEISLLKKQQVKASQEISTLKSKNRDLQSERDSSASEISLLEMKMKEQKRHLEEAERDKTAAEEKAHRLLDEISASRFNLPNLPPDRSYHWSAGNSRFEFELQNELHAERQRRHALESTFRDRPRGDYDLLNDMKKQRDEARLSLERCNQEKDLLEKMVRDLSSNHKRETEELQSKIEAQQEELDDLTTQVDIKNLKIGDINKQLEDEKKLATLELESLKSSLLSHEQELFTTKERLLQLSQELKASEEENKKLTTSFNNLKESNEADCLALKQVQHDLNEVNDLLKSEQADVIRMKAELEYLGDENTRIKKEFNESISAFEEMSEKSKKEKIELQGIIEDIKWQMESEMKESENTKGAMDLAIRNMKEEHDRVLSSKERELADAKRHLRSLMNEIQTMTQSKEKEVQELEALASLADKRTKDLNELKETCTEYQKEIKTQSDQMSVLLSKKSEMEREVKNLKEEVAEKEQALERAKNTILTQESERKEMENLITEARGKLRRAEQTAGEKEAYLSSKMNEIKSLEDAKDKVEAQLSNALNEMTNTEKELEAKLSEALHIAESNELELDEKSREWSEREKSLKSKCKEIYISVFQRLENVLPDLGISFSNDDVAEDLSSSTVEEANSHVSLLLDKLVNEHSRLKSELRSKNDEVDRINGNYSNSLHELDTLSSKLLKLRSDLEEANQELNAQRDLKKDHSDLLEQHEQVKEELSSLQVEKERLEILRKNGVEKLCSVEMRRDKLQVEYDELVEKAELEKKSLEEAQKQRDLFQSRLKEAVDDMEELEYERDLLQEELDRALSERATLSDKYDVLGVENERLQLLDKQHSERIAANEGKMAELKESLEVAESELDRTRNSLRDDLKREYSEMEQPLKEQISTLEADIERLLEENETNKEVQKLKEKEVKILQEELDMAKTELEVRQDELEIAKSELDSLQEVLDMTNSELEFLRQLPTAANSNKMLSHYTPSHDMTPLSQGDVSYPDILANEDRNALNMFPPRIMYPEYPDFLSPESVEYPDILPPETPRSFLSQNEYSISSNKSQDVCDDDSSKTGSLAGVEGGHDAENDDTREELETLRSAIKKLEDQKLSSLAELQENHDMAVAAMKSEFQNEINEKVIEQKNEVLELRIRVKELEGINECLAKEVEVAKNKISTNQSVINAGSSSEVDVLSQNRLLSSEEKDDMLQEIGLLKDRIQDLEQNNEQLLVELAKSHDEVLAAAQTHKNDIEMVVALEKALEETKAAMVEEIGLLKDKIDDLELCNEQLLAKLTRSQNEAIAAAQNQNDENDMVSLLERDLKETKEATSEEIGSLKNTIRDLEQRNEHLLVKLAESQDEVISAAQSHRNDSEMIASMEKTLKEINETRSIEMTSWRDQTNALKRENESLNDELATLKVRETSSLTALEESMEAEREKLNCDLETLKNQVRRLEEVNLGLSNQLTASQADLTSASKLNESEIEKHSKDMAEKNDSLRRATAELACWKEKAEQLETAAKLLEEEQKKVKEAHAGCDERLSLLQIQLQNALNDIEENDLKHKQDAAAINAEFQNTLNSFHNLQKENEKLKAEIQSISSQETDKNVDEKYFEKEIHAAHSRFVSMEKSLQDRVTRLEKEKEKLLASHNEEILTMDTAHTKTKVELSAWKLEMQNALNDIESIKKERNELNGQIQNCILSLEEARMEKAEMEEKLHKLGYFE